jgi:hypothetical protein
MANTISRLTANGNYTIAGQFDEATFNPNQSAYRKNLLNNSATPTNAAGGTYPWNGTFANTAVFQVANTADPIGTFTAYKFVEGYSVNPQYVFWQQSINTSNSPYNTGTTKVGLPYTFSMYAKAAEYNYIIFTMYDDKSYGAYFNLTTGAVVGTPTAGLNYGSYYVGSGWWRIWISKTAVSPYSIGQVFFNFNPTGNQQYAGDGVSGGFFWGPQLEQSSYPTIYEPTGLNGIPASNLSSKLDTTGNYYISGTIDEVSYNPNSVIVVNTVKNSANLLSTGSNWSGFNANLSPTFATTAPDGTYTAYKLTENLINNNHFWQQQTSYTAGVLSFYAKAAERNFAGLNNAPCPTNANVNLANGAITLNNSGFTNCISTYVGNGWWRFSGYYNNKGSSLGQVSVAVNNAATISSYQGDGVSGIYIWGMQFEPTITNTPSIYVPTNSLGLPNSTSIMKADNAGNSYITGTYDEVTKGQNIVTNGLIYYFDPAKPDCWNGSSNTFYDLTNTNPPGTLVGGYSYNYNNGGVITLDGVSGYANTGIYGNTAQYQTNSSYTLSIWVKITGPSSYVPVAGVGQTTLFGCLDYAGYGIYAIEPAGSNIDSYVQCGIRTSGVQVSSGAYNISFNTWYNFVMTYNGTGVGTQGLNFYQNGTSLYSNSTIATGQLGLGTTDYINAGRNLPQSNAPAGTLPGQIGQALIYNRVLSNTEILQNFSDMRSQYGV